jgi:hypothetical protein
LNDNENTENRHNSGNTEFMNFNENIRSDDKNHSSGKGTQSDKNENDN